MTSVFAICTHFKYLLNDFNEINTVWYTEWSRYNLPEEIWDEIPQTDIDYNF
jgi:hypothetical protein